MLRDDHLGTAFVEIGNDGVAVERLVGEECTELDAVDEWSHADSIEAVAGQQVEANKVVKRIGQGQILVVMPPLERPMAWL